jgi:hypothetical protein
MERRKFLKSLFAAGIMLSPVSALLKSVNVAEPQKDVTRFSPDECLKANPYIIEIENLSDRAVSNVDILGACFNSNSDFFTSDGDLRVKDVIISSGLPGVPYKAILYQSMMNPFMFDKMLLEFSDTRQAHESLRLVTYDPNGNCAIQYIVPMRHIKPFDIDVNSILVENTAVIDGYTKINFPTIYPKARIFVRLYPAIKVPGAFGNPQILKP